MNVYGFAHGDPITYGDAFGLSADSIKLQLVKTGPGGEMHSSIRITPDEQARWAADPRFAEHAQRDAKGNLTLTIGAGPRSVLKAVLSFDTPLVSEYNRPGDTGPQNATYLLSPGLQGENVAIDRLLRVDANYRDNLTYELFPRLSNNKYNSNGYITGLLTAAGMPLNFCTPYWTPGSEKPVPSSEFLPTGH